MALINDILQALSGGPGQADRLLRLHTPLGADVLAAERLDGWEAIDQGGFRFELSALSTNAGLELAALDGAPVLIELLTADSRTVLRPLHGHVSAFERVGSNGGMARYKLVVEPWLGMLRLRQDSYAFHDLSVIEIVEEIFGYYAQGQALPAWRWDLADRSIYLKRSLTTQYQETDYDFVERLLAEEGIHYRFEHQGDAASESFGSHTLLLADHNDSFQPSEPQLLRFQRADATESEDSVQQWQPRQRWQTAKLARASWDYRSLSLRAAAAEAAGTVAPAEDDDTAGPYAWQTSDVGQRRSQQHLDALHVASRQYEGAGTLRRLAPGLRFALSGHPAAAAAVAQVCLRVEHHARNNLSADLQSQLEQWLGQARQALGLASPATLANNADEPLYHNTFLALPISQRYRPQSRDEHGRRLHPKPTVSGAQTAIVVGDGAPLLTERDHRIKLQFHWQRGGNAANRQTHPRGQSNAPADGGAGTWVRVAADLAGGNWGSVHLPRVGQEVWVAFLEGDIDRPIVTGAVYNGQGNDDAQHNGVAGGPANSTGNAAAWFAGNEHPAMLSGIKTQDLASSQSGAGGYRQLQFDDSAGQQRAQLYTTDHDSGLNLGHFKHSLDNQQLDDRGYGAELSTVALGAVRGGQGLLLSTAAGSRQMDAGAVHNDLAASQLLTQGLTEVAQKQGSGLDGEPAAEQLPAVDTLKQQQETLAASGTAAAAGQGIAGGDGTAPAWSEPSLIAHGAAGIASVTPQSHIWVAGTQFTLSAGKDLNLTQQGKTAIAAGKGIALFTQGGDPAAQRPVQELGIALHAASGVFSAQAQAGKALLSAEQAITLASTEANILAQAKQHVLLTASGAYLRLQGSDIELGAPGVVEFKSAHKELLGPRSSSGQLGLAASKVKECPTLIAGGAARGASSI